MKIKIKYIAVALGCFGALLPDISHARPVSYPGGWTVMEMLDKDEASLHIHYSPTATYSVGGKAIHFRESDMKMGAIQVNNLVKRWNMPAAQANIYIKSALGVADLDGSQSLSGFTGVSMDIEDRRFFASYENRFLSAGRFDKSFKESVRLGVAPYVAEYGALHTWAMVQVDHTPGEENMLDVKPLLRFFKGPSLLEVGSSLNGGMTVNFVQRF